MVDRDGHHIMMNSEKKKTYTCKNLYARGLSGLVRMWTDGSLRFRHNYDLGHCSLVPGMSMGSRSDTFSYLSPLKEGVFKASAHILFVSHRATYSSPHKDNVQGIIYRQSRAAKAPPIILCMLQKMITIPTRQLFASTKRNQRKIRKGLLEAPLSETR
jgi:hypothetical protein